MNVYDFFSDSAKKTREASIPNEETAALTKMVNEHESKTSQMSVDENGNILIPDLSVTDKAKVKSLTVEDSLHFSGGRLYIASRHPEETNAPSASIELHEMPVVIETKEWDEGEKNMGTEENPINVTCYTASFETNGMKTQDIIEICKNEVEGADPNLCTYMTHIEFKALFDQMLITLLPAYDEFVAGKEYPIERPVGRIAFTVRYVQ